MADEREPKEILSGISDEIKTIVRGEVELAKAEIVPSVKNGGVGAGLFGGAGYFALNGLSLLFMAAALGIAVLIKHWWALGFAIMGVALLIIAGILALIGKAKFGKAARGIKAQGTVTEAKRTIADVKAGISRGNERVKQPLDPAGEERALESERR